MKLLALHQSYANRNRTNRLPLDSSMDGPNAVKSPSNIFWLILHCLCCLISLVLGFRFSRLVFYLFFSTSSINNLYTSTTTTSFASASDIAQTLSFTTSNANTNNITTGAAATSRVVVGRHGIRIRPWPHPDPVEVMKAHRIIEAVQREQKVQYGIKNPRSLIVVTPTYVRTFQALHLTGLMHTLMNLPYDVVWIVVEAGGATNETAALLAKSKVKVNVKVMHIGFEKKMPIFWEGRHKVESEMRLKALRVVREEKLDGIVMFADDSNMHSLELFDEIQNVEWIGAISVGILAHSSHSDEDPFEVHGKKTVDEEDEKKSPLAVQGPACNASDRLSGWHTFNTGVYKGKNANYIGDMAVVLPRKLEWSGFVMNSRLVWKEAEFRPDWIKDLDVVVAGDGEDDIGSPLSLVKDASMVEPLGRCGKKVMLWWLRAEARADSKFPSGWIIDPPLEMTVPAKRTPWPDVPPELPSNTQKVISSTTQEITEKRATKTRTPKSRRSSRGKRKHESRNADARVTARNSGEKINL
ncbi:putative 1,4-beta-D-xylan synthase [Helianthus annuus]|uniref:Glycosyltransferases n=1 Tax=Helianthus annuus TaxID=4232 RepID=A0A251SMC8_HELAN|nr:beta-1,4-xylosyltransferase IRX14 [Helianthus annuus]KAF5791683.1 putative 1,4-beta-D-xylan synthase [Helianthus annuus]KAJ0535228.1 putative 1,4-beta-D-xylan synthase [Helianthus annuus]KAJ0543105.1 putative 1,4-beta-D-xylan synthase [Helianthus annuus]KAJ0708158.1 putative 1,4-beta-D-xylan synthase [Helianthus annuus]KAJ0712115.1 putative 1,4-beta-D-xylan synthase [Helianthus annuus]